MAVRIEDIDKAIAEVIGSYDGVEESNCATKRGYCKLYLKERHIVGLPDRLWKVTAVPVTTWHTCMPCARYDGIYKLPKESHYFSYLPVECADWIAHEGATAEKRFMYMSFWKGCRLRWRLHWWFTPSFLPTLRPLFLMRSGGKWFRHLYIRSLCLELSQMRLKTCNSKMVSLYV